MRWSSLVAIAMGLGAIPACTCSSTQSPEGEQMSAPAQSAVATRPLPDPDLLPPGQATQTAQPIVDLEGKTRSLAVTLVDTAPQRVYSRSLRTWIYELPARSSAQLGYLRVGGSAPINGPTVASSECAKGWQPIKPRGFVCMNDQATYDVTDPLVELTREYPPEFGRKLPYIYGTVRKPGATYARLPERAALAEAEPDFERRIPEWLTAGGEIGASYAPEVWLGPGQAPIDAATAWSEGLTRDVPELLQRGVAPGLAGQTRSADQTVLNIMRPKTGYAFLQTMWWQGRRYGLTTQMELVPVDRLRPIRGSDFHGYVIGKDVEYPFALVRSPAAKFRSGSTAGYRMALPLTGKQAFFNDVLHYETKAGEWISDRFASRLDPPKKLPGWAKQGEKWIDVNVTKQTLVLYEGETPVYATLVSTGEAGLSDHETTTATKLGIFRIHTKHVTSTMSSEEVGEEFELREVPYVMYFDKEGYALHGAYWHDRFGIPKSHGCINLAPEDARRIFHWTLPSLPLGWHGVLLPLKGTVLFIHA
jgi:L,D-transpeptidase catalytic domain